MIDKLKAFFQIESQEEGKKETFTDRLKVIRDKCFELIKKLDKQAQAIYIGLIVAMIILAPWLVGFFTMISLALDGQYSLSFAASQSVGQYLIIGLFPGLGLASTIFVYILGLGIMMLTIIIRSPDLSPIAETDDRGVNFAVDGTYGTAKWMSKDEAKKVFCVGDIREATGYILGQFTSEGKECISLPMEAPGNKNFLVIGSPGRGKTFSVGYNVLFQAIVRGESVVAVDPKGELCEVTYNLFKQHGYVVWVYNMVHPERSNAWNFSEEIFDVNTGRMDFSRLTAYVDIVMTNTMDGEKEDGFWGPGERNLFQAVVAYNGWKYEQTYEENLNRAADQWEEQDLPLISDEEKDRLFSIIRDPKKNLREKETALRLIMKSSNLVAENEIDDYIREIKTASDPVTIDRIFGMLVKYDLNEVMQMFDEANIPTSHPASIAWSMFKHSDAKIQPNFVQGLSQRLKLFANTDINSMSAHEDINFRTLGDRKCAIFCVISDKDSSRKLLTSLFFSFLFRDVSDAADELGAKNRIPVNVMCDEFANIGHIPDFDRVISTVRSRKIYLTIIIQSVTQLAKAYDEYDQGTIIEGCDTVIFLGCNGDANAEFISNLSGVATIITNSVRDNKNISGMRGIAQGYATSEGAGKRNLVTPDEAKHMGVEEIYIYHAGEQLLKAKRCGYIWHPFYRDGLPAPMPLSKFPRTEEIYGPYVSIFEDVSEVDIKNQKIWNSVNARLNQMSQNQKKHQRNNAHTENDNTESDMPGDLNSRAAEDKPKPESKPIESPKPTKTKKQHTGSSNSTAPVQSFSRRASPYGNDDSGKPKQRKQKNKETSGADSSIPKDRTAQNSLAGIGNTFNSHF